MFSVMYMNYIYIYDDYNHHFSHKFINDETYIFIYSNSYKLKNEMKNLISFDDRLI